MKPVQKKMVSQKLKTMVKPLVEKFLEKDKPEISIIIAKSNSLKSLWDILSPIFNQYAHERDLMELEDITEDDIKRLIIKYHNVLQPIWKRFRVDIFNFKEEILPQRRELEKARQTIKEDPKGPIYPFSALFDQHYAPVKGEHYYDIKVSIKIDVTITASFENNEIMLIKRNPDLIDIFIDIFNDIPINYFEKCLYCEKCIILTRSDKKFHPGCAAKNSQKKKWQDNREVMQQKAKINYQKRKQKAAASN